MLGLCLPASAATARRDAARSISAKPNRSLSATGKSARSAVYFTTPDRPPESSEIVAALVGYIHQAQTSIDVAGFEIDNKADDASARRGPQARRQDPARHRDRTTWAKAASSALKAAGVPVVDDGRDGALMHNKFMVFDRKSVWTGSMNFTENCAYRNNNNGVLLDDARLAENYATKFTWMFEQHKFGGAALEDCPHSASERDAARRHACAKTTSRRTITSPEHVIEHDRPGANARPLPGVQLHARRHRQGDAGPGRPGVEVQGVFEKSQVAGGLLRVRQVPRGRRLVHVCLDANPRNMHHKVIVLDDEMVMTGSFNFSDERRQIERQTSASQRRNSRHMTKVQRCIDGDWSSPVVQLQQQRRRP